MDLAIEFNNIGVSYLNIGKRKEACDMFKGGFELLTLVSKDHSIQSDVEVRSSPLLIKDKQHIQNAESLMSQRVCDYEEKVVTPPSQQEEAEDEEGRISKSTSFLGTSQHPFVFLYSLKMAKCGFIRRDCFSPRDMAKIAVAVVSCNLALVHHTMWLDSPGNRKVLQDQVLRAYEISNQMLSQSSSAALCLFLKTILLNNMGQIHHELGNYDLSRSYFDRLVNIIRDQCGCEVNSWQEVSYFLEVQTEDSWEVMKQDFLLNATFLTAPQVAPAS